MRVCALGALKSECLSSFNVYDSLFKLLSHIFFFADSLFGLLGEPRRAVAVVPGGRRAQVRRLLDATHPLGLCGQVRRGRRSRRPRLPREEPVAGLRGLRSQGKGELDHTLIDVMTQKSHEQVADVAAPDSARLIVCGNKSAHPSKACGPDTLLLTLDE